MNTEDNPQTIVINVEGGIAYVDPTTIPVGHTVTVNDHDSESEEPMITKVIESERREYERLEYLRTELRRERISTGELIELQSLAPFISPGDVELLEAAGVPEFPEFDEPEQRPTPSMLIREATAAFNGTEDIDPWNVIASIVEDVLDSVRLAATEGGVDVSDFTTAATDYFTNTYL